jgi:periplasmic mercuric ion binding protein
MMRWLPLLLLLILTPLPAFAADATVTLAVENMTCATCPITVRAVIRAVSGVWDVQVDFRKKVAVVSFDASLAKVEMLTQASRNDGFPATRKE